MMYRLFVKIKSLILLPTANQVLVEFMHILRAFCHLLTSLVPSKNSLIDASRNAQVVLNYTLNHFFYKLYYKKLPGIFYKQMFQTIYG